VQPDVIKRRAATGDVQRILTLLSRLPGIAIIGKLLGALKISEE